jgi:hypothetical protein
VTGFCECGDEPLVSCATELVSYRDQFLEHHNEPGGCCKRWENSVSRETCQHSTARAAILFSSSCYLCSSYLRGGR